jgi:hypothetical protein
VLHRLQYCVGWNVVWQRPLVISQVAVKTAECLMEEAKRGLSDPLLQLQLPAVTVRDPRDLSNCRVELRPSRVPIHPFIKQKLNSSSTTPRHHRQSHHTPTGIRTQRLERTDCSVTEEAGYHSNRRVVSTQENRDQHRYRSRSDPLPTIWTNDSEQNRVLDRRRRKVYVHSYMFI